MAKPLLYPEWATTDTTLPATGNTNKQRPKESLRNIGWDKGQIPTAEEWNWQFDNISDWVVWFNENNLATKTFTATGDATGSANFTNEGNITVTLEVQNNSHTHTSTNISDATYASTPNTVAKRDASGNLNATTVDSISGNISILTGVIVNGGTIPLPSGYTQSQCKWIATPALAYLSDPAEPIKILMTCTVDSNRVVTITSSADDFGGVYTDNASSANYMIIGVK